MRKIWTHPSKAEAISILYQCIIRNFAKLVLVHTSAEFITARNGSYGKVMFSQVSVCPQGVAEYAWSQVPSKGGGMYAPLGWPVIRYCLRTKALKQ